MMIAYAILYFLGLIISFVALVHAKHLVEEGVEFTLFWQIIFRGLFGVFVLGDVIWNVTYGTISNFELPREWTFTARCKRHKAESEGWRLRHATWWCRQLDQIDSGHC